MNVLHCDYCKKIVNEKCYRIYVHRFFLEREYLTQDGMKRILDICDDCFIEKFGFNPFKR